MDKLIEFLQKEVPSNANDLNNSIHNTLEIVECTRAALAEKYIDIAKSYFKNRNSDEIINNFENAEKQLENFYYKLHNFLDNYIDEIITSEDTLIDENDNEDITEDENNNEENEEKVDYKKYLVDNTKAYPLSSDFENTTPDSFSFKGETYKVKSYKEMWLKLCEILYHKDNNTFKEIATWHKIRGNKKSYIVYETDKIAQNINNPLRFLNTGIILEGTTNTTQKVKIMMKMLKIYNISTSSVKVFLKSDRHPSRGQKPIGIYKDKSYDYKADIALNLNNNKSDKSTKNNLDISIGKRVYDYFQRYFEDTNIFYDIQNFLNKNWCKKFFNISYPLLKEIDNTKPLKEQTIPDGKSGAYYAQNPKLQINSKLYIIYMQWNENTHRSKLEKWISENPIPEIIQTRNKSKCIYYDFKKDLCGNVKNLLFNQPCTSFVSCKYYSEKEAFIVQSQDLKNKTCPCCGKSADFDYLDITYTKDDSESSSVQQQLNALKCESCKKFFVNYNLYKNYIRNKNLDDLDIKFTKFEK